MIGVMLGCVLTFTVLETFDAMILSSTWNVYYAGIFAFVGMYYVYKLFKKSHI